jgi:glucoamylase
MAPSWTSSDKDLVGTAIGSSRLWFTIGHGIVNEVYCPRIDIPQIRDLGFIVADDAGFWVEVKRSTDYTLAVPAPGVPLPAIVHRHQRFTLSLRFCPDAVRDVLLIDLSLDGEAGLRVYALFAPHLGGTGCNNLAWAGTHLGHGVLWESRGRSERRCWRAGRTVRMRSALRRRATSACPTAGRISLPMGAWPGITPKRGRVTWR